jgi:hypothetical protein
MVDAIRWDEKAGLRRDAIGSQVIDVLKAQEMRSARIESEEILTSERYCTYRTLIEAPLSWLTSVPPPSMFQF